MTCRGVTKAGEPCKSTMNLSADGLCLNHDPERREAARAVHAAGGRARGAKRREARAIETPNDTPSRPKNLEDATAYFSWLVDAGATGRLDARTVHECAFALKGFQSAAEKRDLERKLKEYVKLVKTLKACPTCAAKIATVTRR